MLAGVLNWPAWDERHCGVGDVLDWCRSVQPDAGGDGAGVDWAEVGDRVEHDELFIK